MPTLVLLGAGASHGSEPSKVGTPPLGDKLFGELCKLGGVASRISDDIKKVFDDQGFEVGMGLFNDRLRVQLQSFHRELSCYLADFVPSDQSYYIQLLKILSGRNVIFSSLNYDMMLEEAATMLGMSVDYCLEREPNRLRLIKPHGSINFWPRSRPSAFQNISFSGPGAALEATVQPVDRVAAKHRCGVDTAFSPAISMYAKGKEVSVCPSFVLAQQEMFADACERASRIIIIGVRVVSEDSHIWGPLSDSGAEITYYGDKVDEVKLREWEASVNRKNVNFVEGYFDKAVDQISPYI